MVTWGKDGDLRYGDLLSRLKGRSPAIFLPSPILRLSLNFTMSDVEKAGTSHADLPKQAQFEQDELYQAYASKSDEWHKQMTRRLMRKVDFHLLPLLVAMYLLNFLDRKYVNSLSRLQYTNNAATSHRPASEPSNRISAWQAPTSTWPPAFSSSDTS